MARNFQRGFEKTRKSALKLSGMVSALFDIEDIAQNIRGQYWGNALCFDMSNPIARHDALIRARDHARTVFYKDYKKTPIHCRMRLIDYEFRYNEDLYLIKRVLIKKKGKPTITKTVKGSSKIKDVSKKEYRTMIYDKINKKLKGMYKPEYREDKIVNEDFRSYDEQFHSNR